MKIARTNAILLFTELGFKTASKWNNKRMEDKLAKVSESVDEGLELENEEAQALLTQVLAANEADDFIEVSSEVPEEEGDEIPTTKPAKKAKKGKKAPEPEPEEEPEEEQPVKKGKKPVKEKPAKAAKEKLAKKEKGEVNDALGNRIGSQAAAINAVLGKKAKTEEDIMSETGLGQARIRLHMRYLKKKGLAKQTEKGSWALV